MTNSLIFIGSKNMGPHINAMAYLVDKDKVSRFVFVDITEAPMELQVNFETFLERDLSKSFSDLVECKYENQTFQVSNNFHVYEKLKHIFVKAKTTDEVNYRRLREEMIRIRNTYGAETIVDITSVPKRIAIDILFVCLEIGMPNIALFELKKQIRGLQSLYHMLKEGEDYEYVKLSKRTLLSNNKNRKFSIFRIITAFSTSINLVLVFEFLIYHFQWKWLIDHPNTYGLQSAFDLLLGFFVFGIFQPIWRKWCWGGGAFAILLVLIQILGGPGK